ncbi:phage/plasmid replication domain-containing protein [Tenacibaculum sp.]|uniref:phage/plasmid replication domain-containing protein n=1 Tax=Tenacibaculum sp. TaxID=1906242 RepID=UPI003AA7BFC9
MIDTIKGYRDLKSKHYHNISKLIDKASISIHEKGYNAILNVSNFKITIKVNSENIPYRMYFNGSLSKYYFGNNLSHLNMKTLKKAVDMFSDDIGMNMKKANLTRVDYGYSFKLKHPVHKYLSCLNSYPRFDTNRYKDSIYFFTKYASKTLIFYDKLKEMKSSDKNHFINLPVEYHNKRIMRYEIRFKTNLRRRFNVNKFKVSTLFRKSIINEIHTRWEKSYKKINKIEIGIDPIHLIYEYNGLYKYLAYHGVEKVGYQRISNTIAELNFDLKNSVAKRSKLKHTVNELLKEAHKNTLDKYLIDELDDKIINFKQNERQKDTSKNI